VSTRSGAIRVALQLAAVSWGPNRSSEQTPNASVRVSATTTTLFGSVMSRESAPMIAAEYSAARAAQT
jgi:hypothetical protein